MNITVVGTGYVGLSLAVLLAQENTVTALDILPEKVKLINERRSPIKDKELEEYLRDRELHLTATTDADNAYRDADIIVVMNHGEIVEQGSHEELIARKGKYYDLYMTQYAGFAT